MKKELELCYPCAEKMSCVYNITLIQHRIDQKITCAECGKRRFGDVYLVESVRRKKKPED